MKKTKKIGKVIKWIFLILLVLLILMTLWNMVCGISEKQDMKALDYGTKVDVGGKNMVADIVGEEHETTVILLPGLGSDSPVLEFKPLAEKLSEQYRVITVEPFGYGLSDLSGAERSLNAIVNELHSCVQSLGCGHYYLMAHSLSGVYSLAWANQYPDEVEGFIGIDPSVPKQMDHNPLPVSMTAVSKAMGNLVRAGNFIGIRRLESVSDPRNVLTADPAYPYTDEELKTFRLLTLHRAFNKDVLGELDKLNDNMTAMKQMTFPQEVPVLNFVCTANCEMIPEWEQLHRDIITETERSKVIKLEGEHYLHFDNLQNIVDAVFEWIPAA